MENNPSSLTASGASRKPQPWQARLERLWQKAGVPLDQRPVVPDRGAPADVEARRYAAFVARAR